MRAAASLCVELAQSGGCELLVPGERRPLAIDPSLRTWPEAHTKIAVSDPHGGPIMPAGLTASAVLWVTPGKSLPSSLRRLRPGSFLITPRGSRRGAVFRVSGCGLSGDRHRPGARPTAEGGRMSALAGDRSARVELACFAALAALAALQWTSLVAHPPAGRVVVAVLFVTAAGAAMAAIARLELSRAARLALAAVATVAVICFGMVVVGLPARLLLPGHWDELGANLSRSLDGVADVPVPYSGADAWTRLVILLASPLVVGLAAFVAFWPTRRRVAGRISALVLLVALYLIALAWARPGRQLAGGILLAILIAAWLWLPGIAPRSRGAASIAVIAAAVVALPAAAAIDTGRGLIDYRHWDLLSANGQSFNWDQTYGPLDWPQKGTPLMEVASEHSHYWKTTNLDEFNGTRWIRATAPGSQPALGEPLKFHPKGTVPRPPVDWIDRINITDRGLNSDFAVGAGTVLAISRIQARPAPDAIWSMTNELRPGDTYTALVYDPKPSAGRDARRRHRLPRSGRHYVSFDLPGRTLIQTPYWGQVRPRLDRRPGARHSVPRDVRARPAGRRRRAHPVRGRTEDRALSAQHLCVPPERSPARVPPARVPVAGPSRILPAVLGDDGPDAADARHPEPRVDRLRAGRTRSGAQQLPGRRHGRT